MMIASNVDPNMVEPFCAALRVNGEREDGPKCSGASHAAAWSTPLRLDESGERSLILRVTHMQDRHYGFPGFRSREAQSMAGM